MYINKKIGTRILYNTQDIQVLEKKMNKRVPSDDYGEF
jgi:hypothetical protein